MSSSPLHLLDWIIISSYVLFALVVGSFFTRKASKNLHSFFVGDRKLPWWIAGTSIVATTFAADTPLAVTGIVATYGISGNWIWWCWAIAHIFATFLFARLWRRSQVITDAEITELRYQGNIAAWLRGFKAVYFGVFINSLQMAWVIAAMVKISRSFFTFRPSVVISACVLTSVIYTTLGGFRSVVITDFVQFIMSIGGAILLAGVVIYHFGGMGSSILSDTASNQEVGLLGALKSTLNQNGQSLNDTLDFIPAWDHPTMPMVLFFVMLGFGWWRYAEGNGYIVQRLSACKNEHHAQRASLWFAVAHNALRPWPWIIVGLASLVIFPVLSKNAESTASVPGFAGSSSLITVKPTYVDVALGGSICFTGVNRGDKVSIADQTVTVRPNSNNQLCADFEPFTDSMKTILVIESVETGQTRRINDFRIELKDREMAYPLLMKRFLPPGLLGLLVASLLAAFMSTIDTHTNWGASYLVRDLYHRFIFPRASPQHTVMVSRICIVVMACLAGLSALIVENIAEVWRFLINLGAGLGSVTAVRWYWSRVTPHAEFAALGMTTLLAVGLQLFCTTTIFGTPNPLFIWKVSSWAQILIIAIGSLSAWVPVVIFGPRNDESTLRNFAAIVQPIGPGWRGYTGQSNSKSLMPDLIKVGLGCVVVYGCLFGIGHLLLGRTLAGGISLGLSMVCLYWIWKRPMIEESIKEKLIIEK